MKTAICAAVLAACLFWTVNAASAAEPSQTEKVQAALDAWLAARAAPEKVTGVAAYVSLGDAGPAIEAFSGKMGREPDAGPVNQDTLYHMGSTSKSFTAAVILKLEAAGKLSIDDRLGKWLPQYPAWKDATIRQLLDMTSGIPTYSETEWMSHMWVSEPKRSLTFKELVAHAYPLPMKHGYFYSNTNYILAGMIAEKASGKSYRDLVHEMVIEPQGLYSTFYEPGKYPPAVIKRLSHGYFANEACSDYQPNCTKSWNLPLIGRDMREDNISWTQAAGGAISSARDVDRWMRAVFSGKVVPPKQQSEWMQLVSTKTGKPIAAVTPDDPSGFSLSLANGILGPLGAQWFYQGETLGYRTLYVWISAENLMITVQTNSQPPEADNNLKDLVGSIYDIVRKAKSD